MPYIVSSALDKTLDLIALIELVGNSNYYMSQLLNSFNDTLRLNKEVRLGLQKVGIEKAKAQGKYTGRKPIVIDESLFLDVFNQWKRGDITATEAMKILNLKPNTFYRRVKDLEEGASKEVIKRIKSGKLPNIKDNFGLTTR